MAQDNSRNNPAQENRYNAWRYPSEEEVSKGRLSWDMFWVGSSLDLDGAVKLLKTNPGQIQFGLDGQVYPIGFHGVQEEGWPCLIQT